MKLKLSIVFLLLSIVIGNNYSTNASENVGQSGDSKPAADGSSTGQAASSGYVRNNYKTLPAAEKFRSVIVHLDRWKYEDIKKECINNLSKDGYAAVQISPVTRHPLPDNKYPGLERYSVTSYEIDSESGTEDQLKSMIKECNDVNVRVLIDVVLNNMMKESDTLPTGKEEVKTRTKTKQYGPDDEPPMFFDKHFHTAPTLEDSDYVRDTDKCRVGMLGGRHDLKQVIDGVPNVHMVGFLYKLIAMGAAGFRVLNADHMEPEDLVKIYDTLPDVTFEKTPTRPFIYSDVYAPVADEGWEIKDKNYIQYTRVTDYKFAREIAKSFQHHENYLSIFNDFAIEKKAAVGVPKETEWCLRASDDSVVFLNTPMTDLFENRALTPVPTTMHKFINPAKNDKAAKLGLGFMLTLGHGIPLITTAHTDNPHEKSPGPVPEPFHRLEKTKQVMSWRNYILKTYDGKFPAITGWNFHSESYQGGYCVGTHGFVVFNNQKKEEDLKMNLKTCFTKSGFYCDIYSGGVKNAAGVDGNEICAGKFIFVDAAMKADVTMPMLDGLQLYNTEVVIYRD